MSYEIHHITKEWGFMTLENGNAIAICFNCDPDGKFIVVNTCTNCGRKLPKDFDFMIKMYEF